MEFKKFEDTKRVIRSCKSKNERQHNDLKKRSEVVNQRMRDNTKKRDKQRSTKYYTENERLSYSCQLRETLQISCSTLAPQII